jgi:succinate dehydrogenase / fumarate reductase iron-sulfur subunit
MDFELHVWRQKCARDKGRMEVYPAQGISAEMSFLEMLDVVNEGLAAKGIEPIAFDHDCREGICGMCSLVINGIPHGPERATTTCELYMRHFRDGQKIFIEPWRARAFPVLKDLIVDRTAFDRVVQAGGFISVNTGSSPEANTVPVPKEHAELSMDAAACIGCGACVAACKNASAMLFVAAKVSHLGLLPQGRVEARDRIQSMVKAMDKEGFGNCTNQYECEAVCPKAIGVSFISLMNREYLKASYQSPTV